MSDHDPNPEPSSATLLVPCHGCGYDIPRKIGETCPECNSTWTKNCEHREVKRRAVIEGFSLTLQAATVAWFIALFIYGVGATVGAMGGSAAPFLFVLFGIGFGVFMSNAIGIGISRLGPEHQFKLIASVWVKKLYWLHMPWLSIAAFSIIGTVIAVLLRIFPVATEDWLFVIVLIELVAWGLVSILALIKWFIDYGEQRRELGIKDDNPVPAFHIIFALMIWIGCIGVGFFGGMLGALFMAFASGVNPGDF